MTDDGRFGARFSFYRFVRKITGCNCARLRHANMDSKERESAVCPAGEPECPRLDELAELTSRAAELAKLVHKDSLTGLFNYRHFQLAISQEMERTRRTGSPVSIIMADLDHFKKFNDQWGHEAGNQVLKHVGELITLVMRKIDILCRYGGEEFALLLPATELPRAVEAANRLRSAFEKSPVEMGAQSVTVTASFGVEVFMKGDSIDEMELVRRADALLYQAKSLGRNRVCHRGFDLLNAEGQVSRKEKDELLGS